MKNIVRFFLRFSVLIFIAGVFTLIFIDHSEISERIVSSLQFSFTKLIPSLYFSLCFALLLTETNLYLSIGKLFSFTSKKIFGIPERMFSIFVISNLAGYPTGAKLLSNMKKSDYFDSEYIKKAAPVMFSAGPAFILSVSRNETEGIVIFLSVVITNFIMLFIFGKTVKLKTEEYQFEKITFTSEIFIKSVLSAFTSMINIAALSAFFAIFTGVFFENELNGISPVFDVTKIFDVNIEEFWFIPIASAYISFGGICVAFQVAAELKENFSAVRFFTLRIISALLSAFISVIIFRLVNDNSIQPVFFSKEMRYDKFNLYISDHIFPAFAILVIIIYKTEMIVKKLSERKM